MRQLSDLIQPDSLTIAFLQPGAFDIEVQRTRHSKVAPCTIIATATHGRYAVSRRGEGGLVAPGGVFIASAGDLLTIDHIGDEATGRMSARWVHATFRLWNMVDLTSFLSLPLIVEPEQGAKLVDLVLRIEELGRCDTLPAVINRQALGWELLASVTQLGTMRPDADQRLVGFTRLAPVLGYLQEQMGNPICVHDLAEVAGMSPSHLYLLFQRWLQTTPMEFLKEMRVHRAGQLLLSSDLSVAEVSDLVGFANPFHFSRVFHQIMGATPSAYRQSPG